MIYSLDWPYANQPPKAQGTLKLSPEDFQVDEIIDENFSGSGEHQLIKVQKSGKNTEDVVKEISRLINKPAKLISYAGLKDRQALTTQWLSIHLPGEEIEGIEALQGANWRVIAAARHHKKLKTGYLSGNHFTIKLREVSHVEEAILRLEEVKLSGVPNYFGEQRFGRGGGNLQKAQEMFCGQYKVKDRFLKGIYLSAARSYIFNQILAKRIEEGNWNEAIPGDVLQLSGTHSIFAAQEIDDTIHERIKQKDISPTSPLVGDGKMMASEKALELIESVCEAYEPWINGLKQQRVEMAWRANILHVTDLNYQVEDDSLILSFSLPAGTYATTVLREILNYQSQ